MQTKARTVLYLFVCGFFLLLDQSLKWQATHSWRQALLWRDSIGWGPFLNPGIAFSLPVPLSIVIIATLIVVGVIFFKLGVFFFHEPVTSDQASGVRTYQKSSRINLQIIGLCLIVTGAISNLADRVFYRATIDYIQFFNGIINLADVLIVIGFVTYIVSRQPENGST